MEDYKLRDLRASHTLGSFLELRGKKEKRKKEKRKNVKNQDSFSKSF